MSKVDELQRLEINMVAVYIIVWLICLLINSGRTEVLTKGECEFASIETHQAMECSREMYLLNFRKSFQEIWKNIYLKKIEIYNYKL